MAHASPCSTSATWKGQVPRAYHPLCIPATPFWQVSLDGSHKLVALASKDMHATACLGRYLCMPVAKLRKQPYTRVCRHACEACVCMLQGLVIL